MNVIETLKKYELEIKKNYKVKQIGIFGSFAKGLETKKSDVDVLVEFERGYKTFDNYMELKFYLEKLFNRKIDLVTNKALRPQIKKYILQEVVYA